MKYLVMYDITQEKARRQIDKILKNYGIRMQKSFFKCELKTGELTDIVKRINEIIDAKTDSVLMYPICRKCELCEIDLSETHMTHPQSFLIL